MECDSLSSYRTSDPQNPKGVAEESSLTAAHVGEGSSELVARGHFCYCSLKGDDTVELETHLLLLCLIAAKAVYYLVFFPRGEHDPL